MTEVSDGSSRAAVFFRQRGLDRVIDAARESFWRNGRVAGSIALEDATVEEHSGIAALAGRRIDHGPLRLNLADFDDWLRASGFECSLADALAAYDGRPPGYRADERARARREAAERRDECRRLLEGIADELPPDSLGRRWLEEGSHGTQWLVQRFQNLSLRDLHAKGTVVRTVTRALSALPLGEPRRIAVFANDIVGDPHAFDPDQEIGRLFSQALLDQFGDELGIEQAPGNRPSAANQRDLLARVGLLRETISSTVAAWHLGAVIQRKDSSDADGSPAALQILSLRQLLGWQAVWPASRDVFVVENPVVFEDLLDGLRQREAVSCGPTLICTAGWLNLASWRLLDLLVSTGEVRSVFYSGDFDLSGLRIAESLRKRYPDHFRAWRLAAGDYHQARRETRTAAPPEDVAKLTSLSPEFADLIDAIRKAGCWAYQEAIVDLLLADLQNAGSGESTHLRGTD